MNTPDFIAWAKVAIEEAKALRVPVERILHKIIEDAYFQGVNK